jgi:hypothetical protein
VATISIPNDSGLTINSFSVKGGGVDVLGLSSSPVAPGSIMTLVAQGSSINPALDTTVVLTDSNGRELRISNIPVQNLGSGASLSFTIPTFVDWTTFQPGSGNFSVRVEQASAGTANRYQLGSLAVLSLPPTGVQPGAIVSEFLSLSQQLVQVQMQNVQAIGGAAGGTIDLSQVLQSYQNSINQYTSLQQMLAPLISGQVSQVGIGQISGKDVFLNRDSLSLLDRQLLSGFQNNVQSIQALAGEGESNLDAVTSTLTRFISKDFIREAGPAVSRLRSHLSSGAGLAVTGAFLLGSAPVATALLAGGLAGAAVFGVTTLAHLAISTSIQGGVNSIVNGRATYQDFRETAMFAADSALDAALTYVVNRAGAALPTQPLGQVLGTLADAARGQHDAFTKGTTSTQAIFDQFDAIYGYVHAAVSSPRIGVSPSSLSFQVAVGGAAAPSQSFVVTNTGHGTLSYSVSASLTQIHVTGGSRSLDENRSDTLSVSIDANGLVAGSYQGTIMIIDSTALNSPVTVPVYILVVTGRAQVSPTSLGGTVEQGVTARGDFTVRNIGQTGTVLRYTFLTSDSIVSVTGSPTPLAAGQSASFQVNVNTAGLAPRSQPYVFQVFVFNTDYAPSDSNGLSIIDVSVTVTAKPAVIQVIPGSLSFTATVGSPMANESRNVQIVNAGPPGSQLSYQLTDDCYGRLSVTGSQTTLPSNYYDLRTFRFNTSGLAANTYPCNLYVSSPDSRVSQVKVPIQITVSGVTLPAWGAYESGEGRGADTWYSISSAPMTIRFYMQPFQIKDSFRVTDEFGRVYVNTGPIGTQDRDFNDPPRPQQSPYYFDFVKPAGVTRLRVQVIADNPDTGWWYYGRTPGQPWY